MLLKLRFVLVLGIVMQAAPPLPWQTTGTTSAGSSDVKQNGKGKKTTTAPTTPLGEPKKPIGTDEHGGHIADNNAKYDVTLTSLPAVTLVDKKKTHLDIVFDWGPWVFNCLLVGIGILALIVAHRQAGLMAKQATMMEQQSALQTRLTELQYDQWVELIEWGTMFPKDGKIPISVQLANRSTFPMMIEADLEFVLPANPKYRFRSMPRHYLTPEAPLQIYYEYMIPEALIGEQAYSFLVTGSISHPHRVSNKTISQPVEGFLTCAAGYGNVWTASFTTLTPMSPETSQTKPENQQPN